MDLHLRRIEILLALDIEFAIGTPLQLETDDDACVFGDKVSDDGQIGSECLDRFNEAGGMTDTKTKRGRRE